MIRFAKTARRHGISQERIRYVIQHSGLVYDVPPPADSPYTSNRTLYVGDDAAGVALEILAITTEGGDLLVFHAKRLGSLHRVEYQEAMKCRI
jgi:hypothetical protein